MGKTQIEFAEAADISVDTLARAENGLGNKAASQAALKEAAKYPETKKWAEAALRQGLGN